MLYEMTNYATDTGSAYVYINRVVTGDSIAYNGEYVVLPPLNKWDGCWHPPKEAQSHESSVPRPLKRWVELKPKSPSSLWHRFIQCQRQR